jgi:hypothetical protein
MQVEVDQAYDSYLDPAGGRITRAEWVALWESGHLAGDAKITVYRSHLRNHILPRFGHVPLHKITRHAIKTFVVHLRRNLADSSVASVMSLVNLLLREAVARSAHRPQPRPRPAGQHPPPGGTPHRHRGTGRLDRRPDQPPV